MDIFLYKNAIKEVEDKYSNLNKKIKKLIIIYIAMGIIITAIMLLLKFKLNISEDLVIATPIVYFVLGIPGLSIWYIIKKDKLFYHDFSELITKIIRSETKYDITRNDKAYYYDKLIETRFINSGSSISINSSFDFEKEGIKGSLIIADCDTGGEHSTPVIHGVVVSINIPTFKDHQIRSDYYIYNKMKKSKSYKGCSYYVLIPKEMDTKEYLVDDKTIEIYNYLLETTNEEKVGIDYQKEQFSFFVSEKKPIKMPKKFSEERIEEICNRYIHILNMSMEIARKIIEETEF